MPVLGGPATPLRVLVTNDDGVDAPGLAALVTAAAGHEVTVAAPLTEASGASAALTAVVSHGRILMERRPIGYGVAASPAYIVVLATLGVFGPPPDLVLAGVNRGANAGHAVLHSGTVGAALTAANHGVRAMAVSLDVLPPGGSGLDLPDDADLHWDTAAAVARDLLGEVSPGTVLNLNVPDRPVAGLAGVRTATLAPFGQTRMAVAEAGEGFVRTTFLRSSDRLVPGTDLALLAEGYATVTRLRPPAAAGEAALPAQRSPASMPRHHGLGGPA